jgi:hypothetical protein
MVSRPVIWADCLIASWSLGLCDLSDRLLVIAGIWSGIRPGACKHPPEPPAPPPACTWQFKNGLSCNNTVIQAKDLSSGVTLPAGTTDEAGIAACIGACGKVTECAAWVFVSTRAVDAGPTPRW